jgi:hypothetical protein
MALAEWWTALAMSSTAMGEAVYGIRDVADDIVEVIDARR